MDELPLDPRSLRDAFGAFATGVTVVTTRAPDGARAGMTANSFTSVSLEPPLLLVCPSVTASALPALRAAGRFAVNVLGVDAQDVAGQFARRVEDRFCVGSWTDWHGLPVLDGAAAQFCCDLHAEHDGGDHRIVVGRITALRLAAAHEPLLYHGGAYRRVLADT